MKESCKGVHPTESAVLVEMCDEGVMQRSASHRECSAGGDV